MVACFGWVVWRILMIQWVEVPQNSRWNSQWISTRIRSEFRREFAMNFDANSRRISTRTQRRILLSKLTWVCHSRSFYLLELVSPLPESRLKVRAVSVSKRDPQTRYGSGEIGCKRLNPDKIRVFRHLPDQRTVQLARAVESCLMQTMFLWTSTAKEELLGWNQSTGYWSYYWHCCCTCRTLINISLARTLIYQRQQKKFQTNYLYIFKFSPSLSSALWTAGKPWHNTCSTFCSFTVLILT